MSTGLIALLDDVAALAKVAAASLDDVGAQAARAGAKAAGVVIDDAAVTPQYVTGFGAARELPIVARIALGSLRNKLLYLLPAVLVLGLAGPWLITPLLMLGGAYLCHEGAEKVWHGTGGHGSGGHDPAASSPRAAQALEDARVRGAISTDFILSAEIMAITLSGLPGEPLWEQAVVLAIVGFGCTLSVYGAVALIVKADDAGLALATGRWPVTRTIGRALVLGTPWLLRVLTIIGTAAMLWVGGGIIVHGLAGYGLPAVERWIHAAAQSASQAVPAVASVVDWVVGAAGSSGMGALVGIASIPVVRLAVRPVLGALRRRPITKGDA